MPKSELTPEQQAAIDRIDEEQGGAAVSLIANAAAACSAGAVAGAASDGSTRPLRANAGRLGAKTSSSSVQFPHGDIQNAQFQVRPLELLSRVDLN